MSMIEVQAGILDVKANTRVATINLVGAAGAGVAKEFRNNVPGWYAHYKKMYSKITPDQFIVYKFEGEIHLMVPTKIDWKEDSPRDLVMANLEKLAKITRDNPAFGVIALPAFGCGNGGLNYYSDIRKHYVRLFENHPREFIVTLGRYTQ
jgi:hypothetical protein